MANASAIGLADRDVLERRRFRVGCGIAPKLAGLIGGRVAVPSALCQLIVIPRRLVRFVPDSDRPARRQAALRFAGWAFVLAGLANALVWGFAPSTDMALWSMVPIVAAIVLVTGRCLISRRIDRRALATSPSGP